jgi:hypothetical protein
MELMKIAKILRFTFNLISKIQRKKNAIIKVLEGAKVPMTGKQIAYAIPFNISEDALRLIAYKLCCKNVLVRTWSPSNEHWKYSLSPKYESKTKRIIEFIDGE